MKIAITGGIGSGKSYVCRILEKQGIRVYDCDAEAKRLMRTDARLQAGLKKLVGEQVYSASESFAVFCKETGFATLVGSQTGGDGIGALDPIFLQLPNSGLLVQFTMMFGLNADGSSSEEAGTTPDLLSPGTEPPLITALRAIRETA